MEIVYVPTTQPRGYENNPRLITPEAVEYVAQSMREFGCLNPIVIGRDGVIAAGHVRFAAAKKLGLEVIPAVIAEDLTEEELDAYRLADNRVASMAIWDHEKLDAEFAALAESCFDPAALGFDLSMINGDDPETEKARAEIENTSKELSVDDFADEKFAHRCPHCGLRF